jgi:hypothetical protein
MKYWLARAGEEKPEGPFSKAELSGMYHAGAVDMLDQVALHGTERWQDLGKLLGLRDYQDPAAAAVPPPLPQVQAHKKRTAGNGGVGCIMMIVGLVLLLIFWPLGLLLIFGAAILDQASVHYICSACGNQTVRTARHCMACKAVFVPESLARNLAKGAAVGLLCFGLIGWWVWSLMEDSRIEAVKVQQKAPATQPVAQSGPVEEAANNPQLWEYRAKVAAIFTAKGCSIDESRLPRFLTVRLNEEHSEIPDYQELMRLGNQAVQLWRSYDPGYFELLIKAADGEYLVGGDPFSGVKIIP